MTSVVEGAVSTQPRATLGLRLPNEYTTGLRSRPHTVAVEIAGVAAMPFAIQPVEKGRGEGVYRWRWLETEGLTPS
ncbi:hypothetical protein NL676_010241 [Syzygium grande]|nr:hypothetical protein NL676_010241 [Syzygium grande]